MAKPSDSTHTTDNASTSATASTSSTTKRSRFTKVQIDRPQYKPDHDECRSRPLVGYLLSKVHGLPNPNPRDGQPPVWDAYVIQTTEPVFALGIEDGDTPREYPAGTEVLIGESAKLQGLEGFLSNKVLLEVSIQPTKKARISGGREMWGFEVGRNESTMKARPAYMPAQVYRGGAQQAAGAVPGQPALPGIGMGVNGQSDQIPF